MTIRKLIRLLLAYDDLNKDVLIVDRKGNEIKIDHLERDIVTGEVFIVSEEE